MASCIICFTEHNNEYKGEPALYCSACHFLKKTSEDDISKILDNLYLSGMRAATRFEGSRLCVHEETPIYEGGEHIPILVKRPNNKLDRSGAVASIAAMDKVVEFIDLNLKAGNKTLVHCWGGVERSPLAVAYYLHKRHGKTMQEAYAHLKNVRPIVSERLFWLP